MSSSVVALTVFLALACGLGAVLLFIKDLFFSRSAVGAAGSGAAGGPVRLRRLPRISREPPKGGLVAGFDHWFFRLVRETGLSWNPAEAALVLILSGLVAGSAMFIYNEHPLLGAIGMLLGMTAALVYLVIRRARHVRKLQEQLPAALDMLARGMRSGLSLDEAVEMVGQRSPEPLAAEFRHCAQQLAMGLSMPAVMRSLVDRVRLFDVRIFTTTLTVHRQTGGNLAMVLSRLAAVIRDRLNYRRQLRATTGAGRLSAILIGMIGPLLFAYMFCFHPNYMRAMMDSSLGQAMLVAAVALQIIGLIWTARLLKPTY